MQPFNWLSAQNVKNAQDDFRTSPTARYIAGGTTLVDLMKLHVETPSVLVDLTQLPLKKINEGGEFFQVGALVTNNELAHHAGISKQIPMLSQAILSGASVQLRNLATTSGNLLQRTRCSYFRDTSCACNKREPGTGCSALEGNNRMHAILGGSNQCIATHPSDMCVALMALDAVILVQTSKGEKAVPITEFYKLPGETPHIENALQENDLITGVRIPKKSWHRKSLYVKVRDRASYAFALTSAAVALDFSGGNKVRGARIALGGVGTIPWRVTAAEKSLAGSTLTNEKIQEVAELALAHAQPREHNAFKINLAKQTLTRALRELGGLS